MQSGEVQYITSSTGRKKAVVLPILEYQRLIENLHDLAVGAERREEYPVSLGEMKKRLGGIAKGAPRRFAYRWLLCLGGGKLSRVRG